MIAAIGRQTGAMDKDYTVVVDSRRFKQMDGNATYSGTSHHGQAESEEGSAADYLLMPWKSIRTAS